MRLLACESIYWIGINADIECYSENCPTCLIFQQMQSKERLIHHNVPGRPWEVVSADMFLLYNKTYLCIVDYHSKFPVIKKTEGLSASNVILACSLFSECKLTNEIISDAGGNFVLREIQEIWHEIEYRAGSIIIISPPKQ